MDRYHGEEKLKELYDLLKSSLDRLSEVEYLMKLLETEVKDYESLIDKESLIPKIKFVKYKLERLINRLKYGSEEVLVCSGIKIEILGEDISTSDKKFLTNDILSYLDNRIRPTDILFRVNESSMGIIFILKSEKDEEAVINRLNQMLLHIKTKTYSDKNILINLKLKHFRITKEDSADNVIDNLGNILEGIE